MKKILKKQIDPQSALNFAEPAAAAPSLTIDELHEIFGSSTEEPVCPRCPTEVAELSYSEDSYLHIELKEAAAKLIAFNRQFTDNRAPRYSREEPDRYINYALPTLTLHLDAIDELETPLQRFVAQEVFSAARWGLPCNLFATRPMTREGREKALDYVKTVAKRIAPFLTAERSELFA